MSDNASPSILIGGITGGIGSALARILVDRGWRVAGYCRNPDESKLPEGVKAFSCNAIEPLEITDTFAKAREHFGGSPTAYAHCIGSILLKSAHQLKDEEWSQTLRLNLDSAFFSLRSAVGLMLPEGSGSVVLISSVAAQAGMPSHEAISAAKGGINGLVQSAAASYANRGIRINAVAPGLVETPGSMALLSTETARSISQRMHPLGRIGQPGDVAELIAYLVSSEASWVTGQIWSIDGGLAHLRQRPKA